MEVNKIQQEFGVDVSSPVYNERLNELDKTLNDIVDGFNLISIERAAVIPEDLFKYFFLPIFLGETDNVDGRTLSTWVALAGGQYNPVNVIDANRNVLFTVPPIFQRNIIMSNIERVANIADIMTMAKKHHELSPKRGDAYRQRGLNAIIENMRNPKEFLGTLNEWNEIFKRYGKGYNLEVKNNTVAVSNDTNQQVKDDEEFEYD